MSSDFINCPTDKDINMHFYDQLTQLNIKPKTQEDAYELMHILNSYLSYPDDELANAHRSANKLGLLDLTVEERVKLAQNVALDEDFKNNIKETGLLKVKSSTCRCCGFIIQETSIATCSSNLKNTNSIGTATLVFFSTFVNIAILLLVMTVVYSAFAFGTNISSARATNYLNSGVSSLDYLSISLGAKSRINGMNSDGEQYYYISSCLGVLMLIIWWLLFIFFKNEIGKMQNDMNRSLGISDYSVVIENMPIDFTKQQVQKQFNIYLKMLKGEDDSIHFDEIKVVKYNEGKPFYLNESEFKDSQMIAINQSYNQLKDKIAGYVEEYLQSGNFKTPVVERRYNYSKLLELVQKRARKYEEIVNKIKVKLNSKQQVSKTVVFVTFLTHEMRQFVLSRNKNSPFHKLKRFVQCWKKNSYFSVQKGDLISEDIKIEMPPEPEDINWGNLGLSFCQKFWRKMFTILATIIMVCLCFVIVYGLSTLQNSNHNSRYVSILISLAISITNLGIIKVIQYMTVIEKEYSMNNFQISIAIKSVIAQVVNSIIVPFLVNFYIKDRNIFGKSGLVEDIFILGITSSLVPPLVRLFDPYNIFLHIRYKYYSHQVRRLRLSQFELNEMSEKMQFQIGMQYIYMISNYLFICFFVSLQPIISTFGILGLFLMYWIEKYTLLNRCQRPVPGPDVITSTMYQLIYFGPVSFALGNLTWSFFIPDQSFRGSLVISIVTAGISFVMYIFPYDLCLPDVVNKQSKTYYEKRIYFPSEYDRLNPSTSRIAIEQYRKFLNEKRRELQTASDTGLSQQMIQQLANVSQKNIYKGNIMNKFTQNEQDFIIQQIFYNESRNVVNPTLLLNALLAHEDEDLEFRQGNSRNRSEGFVIQGQSMKQTLPEATNRSLAELEYWNIPARSQQDYLNLYHSNIRLDQILQLDSKIKPERQPKRSHISKKRIG